MGGTAVALVLLLPARTHRTSTSQVFRTANPSSGYNVAISCSDASGTGGPLRLSLDTREVGRVTIVRCNGRIVAGTECDSLRAHVAWLLRDRRAIVLHLGEVGFVDSSGLG